jgi:EAL domain-containing protein (putative c-di-GMP-specific phosphodiesterase class I)
MAVPTVAPRPRPAGPEQFRRVLDSRSLQAVFQPIVHLYTREVLGYEAFARGPAGSGLESPAQLFAAAARAGRVAELDWACRAAAFRAAMAARLHPSLTVFVNTEPDTLRTPCPADLRDIVATAENRLRVVLELSERVAVDDPAGLLAAVGRARKVSWGVALDNVGRAPGSLAMMPFTNPDVVKLDLSCLRGRSAVEVGQVVSAVLAQSERTGAAVLVESIETEDDLDLARSLGAKVGQGHLFGLPGDLPAETRRPHAVVRFGQEPPRPAPTETPFELLSASRPTHHSTRRLLRPLVGPLEQCARAAATPAIVLASLGGAGRVDDDLLAALEQIAQRSAFTALFGAGMPPAPAPGVRGYATSADDRLVGETAFVAYGPTVALALAARECGTARANGDRVVEVATSHDRELVITAASALLRHVTADARRAPLR